MRSTTQWDFSHSKNRLGEDRDSATCIMDFFQDYSQLIEYCGIVHFYEIVSVCNPVAI